MSLFTQKELARYSLTKALLEISNFSQPGLQGDATGLEREISDTLKSQMQSGTSMPNAFMLPIACLKAQNVTTATAGGYLVGTELAAIVPASPIPFTPSGLLGDGVMVRSNMGVGISAAVGRDVIPTRS